MYVLACLQATLHEVWRIEIHSRLCADVHSFLGQSVGLDLPIKGDRYVRRVACFASHHAAVNFEQGGKLKIPAGAWTNARPFQPDQQAASVRASVQETDAALCCCLAFVLQVDRPCCRRAIAPPWWARRGSTSTSSTLTPGSWYVPH